MRKVLLIDDDLTCREPAAALLRRNRWDVVEANDGDGGIRQCLEHTPDLVICDLLLPGRNGFDVCKTIRNHPQLRDTKIVVLTGGAYETDKEIALASGADEFLVKPVGVERLLRVADRLVPNIDGATPEPDSGQSSYIQFWGVRGSIPTPGPRTVYYGGNTSCVEVRTGGQIIILDAGTGIRNLGLELAHEFAGRSVDLTLLISHTHWDHIQGFPFFAPAYDARNHVQILGYDGAATSLASTLAGQMESPYFPIALEQMPANVEIRELKEMQFFIGKLRVTACLMNHPGMAVGYRLWTPDGSVAYLPDNEPCCGARHECTDAEAISDIRLDQHIIDFIQGADVLITDAQYDRAEYDCHIGWGHGCMEDVVELAIAAHVQQLFLFHHDPNHSDERVSTMMEEARRKVAERGASLRIDAAREGERFVLKAATHS
jgi:phosphoribosyl 1,2-cyclic phosphodiesterase/CheY-like chemotaxis protein